MAHHLQFLTQLAQELQRLEEAIDLGTHRDTEAEVEDIVETVGGIPDDRTGVRIPLLSYLAGVHAVIQGDAGRDVEVLHHIEGCLNRHRVADAVTPVLDQVLVQELVLLGGQRVLEFSCIADLDFLIPALVTHSALALEGGVLAHGDGQVGERDSDRRVGRALRDVSCCRDGPLAVGNLVGQIHGTALGVLGKGVSVIGIQAVAGIAGGGEVDAGREGQVGVGLLALAVVPQYLEVVHLVVVGVTLLARHRGQVVDTERTRVLVAPGIRGLGRQAPRTTRVDFARDGQVGMLSQRQVVAAITQVETPVIVLTEGGHQDTALVFLAEGEIAKGHSNGQRQVLEHHIGRAGNHIMFGLHLGLGQLEIEVRMLVVVTGGVATVLNIIVVVLGLLGDAAGKVTLALLGDNVGDVTALGLEVVFHHPRLVLATLVPEYRITGEIADGVEHTHGLHLAAVHVHADL